MHTNQKSVTINEAADLTGIGRNTIRQLIHWKKLSAIKIGNKYVIRTETLDLFLRRNEGNDLRNRYEVVAV